VALIPRSDVKRHICGDPSARAASVREKLIDRFGSPGTSYEPGPLHGINGDLWAALALAVTIHDRQQRQAGGV
jgi:hypothetical protein